MHKIKMMKSIITLCVTLLLFGCKDAKRENSTDNTAQVEAKQENSSAAMQIELDGKHYEIEQDKLRKDMVTFEDQKIQFVLWNEDCPVHLNFNLHKTDILEKGAATYQIPEATKLGAGVMVDLNFYDKQRKGKATNSIVVFRKGEIQITQLTKNKLEMSFKGEGNGMLETTPNFPISGRVNVTY